MIKLKDGFNGERALVLPLSVVQEMEKDALSSVLHITDIGYYPKALHHFRERTEPISQFVFIYYIEGAGWFRTNEQEYAVKANQYFILPAGIPHAYGSDESNPWTIYWIHFKGKLASYFAGQANRPIDIKPSIQSRISNRNDLFEEIFHTLEMGYSHENLLYACSAFHYYLGSLRYLQQYREAARDESDSNGPYRLFSLPLLRAIQQAYRIRPTHLLQSIENPASLPTAGLYRHENKPDLF